MTYTEAITQLQDTGCYRTLLKWQKSVTSGESLCIRVSYKASGRPIMTVEINDDDTVDPSAVAYLVGEAFYLKQIHEKGRVHGGR